MGARNELCGRIRSARAFLVAVAVAAALVAVLVGSAAEAATGAGVKRYAYTVQLTYSLARETPDPATGASTTVERRLEAELRVWVNVSEDQVYTGTKGDYAEVDGKAVASVRDNGATPPCAQVSEAKGRIGLKFVTNRAPLTSDLDPMEPRKGDPPAHAAVCSPGTRAMAVGNTRQGRLEQCRGKPLLARVAHDVLRRRLREARRRPRRHVRAR